MLIQDYQAYWPIDFARLSEVLTAALAGTNHHIEHVGSTAVPGLAAKPIIDLDVVYYAPEAFGEIKDSLEQLGYYHNGDQGIPGREVFKRKAATKPHPVLDDLQHHLYVCHQDSPELRRHLLFRDYLRKHIWARVEYGELKLRIATTAGQDRKCYARLKEAEARKFIKDVLTMAAAEPA